MDVYDVARQGLADLVISHYGLPGTERFVLDGLGLWPRTVFASQSAVLGPPADPAGIRGLSDAGEAFRRIAEKRSLFIVNNNETEKYLVEILWEAAGRPERGDWYVDEGLQGQQAVEAAAKRGGYTLWGLVPFVKLREQSGLELDALVSEDPLLLRLMASVVVNPDRIEGVNVEGAKAFERYLTEPATQARIRAFRRASFPSQMWWPAGPNN
jgi:tungstate transport system substrate-binding protein